MGKSKDEDTVVNILLKSGEAFASHDWQTWGNNGWQLELRLRTGSTLAVRTPEYVWSDSTDLA
jgi:hypothetical protein